MDRKEIKECPFCGEEILARAIKCKHCQSMLPEEPPPAQEAFIPPPPAVSGTAAPPPVAPPDKTYGIPASPAPGGGYGQAPPPAQGAALAYPRAQIGKRILAYIIDCLIGFLPAVILAPIAILPIWRYYQSMSYSYYYGGGPGVGAWILFVLAIIAGVGWGLVYFLFRDGFGEGQSVGKKINGLMVVYLPDNSPCSKGKSVVRNVFAVLIGAVLSWIPGLNVLAGWVEPIVALIQPNGQRIGDMVAHTQVIDVDQYRP